MLSLLGSANYLLCLVGKVVLLLSGERFMLFQMDCRSAQARVTRQVYGQHADPPAEVGVSLLGVVGQPESPITGTVLGVHSAHH